MELDIKEMVDYIHRRLLAKNIFVEKDQIEKILDLETEYMLDNGYGEYSE